jgi:hypothetical protein
VVLETVHAVTYFARPCRHALRDTGLVGFWNGYFAARAAPLGRAGAGPVCAAFYNFEPAMVATSVPDCWEVADPATLTVVRAQAAAAALAQACPPAALDRAVGALPSLRLASSHCAGGGRTLAGANTALWPSLEPILSGGGPPPRSVQLAEVWQACTTLREHRGDGHVAALVVHGLGGCAAHVLAAAVAGVPPEVLRDNRGWSSARWDDARAGLTRRGLVGPDGAITDAGRELHGAVEARTDDLAEGAFAAMPDDAVNALYDDLLPSASALQGSGLLPFPNPMGLPRL